MNHLHAEHGIRGKEENGGDGMGMQMGPLVRIPSVPAKRWREGALCGPRLFGSSMLTSRARADEALERSM